MDVKKTFLNEIIEEEVHIENVKFGSIDSHSPMRGHMGTLRLAREIWRIN
jgi:hypothetical protein